jgi:hypothetical protein
VRKPLDRDPDATAVNDAVGPAVSTLPGGGGNAAAEEIDVDIDRPDMSQLFGDANNLFTVWFSQKMKVLKGPLKGMPDTDRNTADAAQEYLLAVTWAFLSSGECRRIHGEETNRVIGSAWRYKHTPFEIKYKDGKPYVEYRSGFLVEDFFVALREIEQKKPYGSRVPIEVLKVMEVDKNLPVSTTFRAIIDRLGIAVDGPRSPQEAAEANRRLSTRQLPGQPSSINAITPRARRTQVLTPRATNSEAVGVGNTYTGLANAFQRLGVTDQGEANAAEDIEKQSGPKYDVSPRPEYRK